LNSAEYRWLARHSGPSFSGATKLNRCPNFGDHLNTDPGRPPVGSAPKCSGKSAYAQATVSPLAKSSASNVSHRSPERVLPLLCRSPDWPSVRRGSV
jgi:hypothetical protein